MNPDAARQAAALYQRQDWPALAALSERAVNADPRDGFAWYYAGLASDGLGRKDRAAADYEKALPTIGSSLRGSVIQLLALDYAALKQPDKIAALCRQVETSDPEIARSLRSQFPSAVGKGPTPVAANLPDVSPAAIAAMLADARRSWKSDAIPVTVSIDSLDNGFGFQAAFNFYSPSTRTGLSMVHVGNGITRLPTENPRWGVIAIPGDFVSLATAMSRIPGNPPAEAVQHAFLFRRSGDSSNPADLVWSIALKRGTAEASVIPAYRMSGSELNGLAAAANRGDGKAQYNLAVAYITGVAGVQDAEKAVDWLTKAANGGNPVAENKLGQFNQYGLGVPVNARAAATWYGKAAAAGFAPGQFNLGLLYETGLGVQQDWIQADRWISAAAKQGLQPAYAEMGIARSAAKREQHRQVLAAQQQKLSSSGCGGALNYSPTFHRCGINVNLMNQLMLPAVHPELNLPH